MDSHRFSWAAGKAPTWRPIVWPSFSKTMVGIDRASKRVAIIGELSRQLDLRDRTLTEVIADRDRVVLMVEEIFGTTSWKATAPLRKLKGMLRGPGQS